MDENKEENMVIMSHIVVKRVEHKIKVCEDVVVGSRYHVKLDYHTNRPDIIRKAEFWTDASGIDDAKSIAMQKFTTARNIIVNKSLE
jgi:hypothetical protein